jgi:hypothetical protein
MAFKVQNLIKFLRKQLAAEAGIAGRAAQDTHAKLEVVRLCERVPGGLATEVLLALVQPYEKEAGFKSGWLRPSPGSADGSLQKAPIGRRRSQPDWGLTHSSVPECIEMRNRGFELRDSKDPDGPVLSFTRTEWATFVDGARRGEFDHLVGFG